VHSPGGAAGLLCPDVAVHGAPVGGPGQRAAPATRTRCGPGSGWHRRCRGGSKCRAAAAAGEPAWRGCNGSMTAKSASVMSEEQGRPRVLRDTPPWQHRHGTRGMCSGDAFPARQGTTPFKGSWDGDGLDTTAGTRSPRHDHADTPHKSQKMSYMPQSAPVTRFPDRLLACYLTSAVCGDGFVCVVWRVAVTAGGHRDTVGSV